MKNDVVPVQIRGILPANSGCALFVGNDEKVFVINVEPNMGSVIGMFLRETPKERPLTHDLMQSVFKGLRDYGRAGHHYRIAQFHLFRPPYSSAAERVGSQAGRDRCPSQ
jgi:hypothetical protein